MARALRPVGGAVGGGEEGVVVDHRPAAHPVEPVGDPVPVVVPQGDVGTHLGALGRRLGVVGVDGAGGGGATDQGGGDEGDEQGLAHGKQAR